MPIIKDSLLHRVIKDSMNATLTAPATTMASHTAVCASFRKLNERASPYIQGSKSFKALSLPKSYLEEIRDFKEVFVKEFEKINTFANTYYEMGMKYHDIARDYQLFGLQVVFGFKVGALVVLSAATVRGLYLSSKYLYKWWSGGPPDSLEAYKDLIGFFLKKKDIDGAVKTLYIMVDNGFVPENRVFESLFSTMLSEKKIQLAGRVLRLMAEIEVEVGDADLISNVLASLFLGGNTVTALKRIEHLSQVNLNRILDALIEAEKKPSFLTCRKLLSHLVSKNEAMPAFRLLESGLFSVSVMDMDYPVLDKLEDILRAGKYEREVERVKNLKEQLVASRST